ncbi:hypothetical protein C8Q80DRAFT_1101397 [Daedaleopsis nitida]|nr:hypothetical protein C8Q80DRAFT_1101397 [Daedaleopsis nitida]
MSAPASILQSLEALPSLDQTFGAVLLGSFIGLMLYGLTIHQSFRYFRLYPTDAPYLKATVRVAARPRHRDVADSYHYLVTNYFNPLGLLDGVW